MQKLFFEKYFLKTPTYTSKIKFFNCERNENVKTSFSHIFVTQVDHPTAYLPDVRKKRSPVLSCHVTYVVQVVLEAPVSGEFQDQRGWAHAGLSVALQWLEVNKFADE